MPHAETDPAVTEIMIEHSRRAGQTPYCQEWPRYVYNEMFTSLLAAAQRLAVNGVASVEDIDRAWMVIMEMPRGPFGIMDNVGLDTCLAATKEAVAADPNYPYGKEIIAMLQAKVDANELGRKQARGSIPIPTRHRNRALLNAYPKYKN